MAPLRWLRSRAPDRGSAKADAIAGIPGAVGSVPDGMAASVLAGVNPIHGLYASLVGPIAGGLSASTQRMVITTTSAAALAAGSAIDEIDPAERPEALFLLTILAGAVMVAAGLLRLGRYTRFVSHSVMTGFLTGVAANIVLGQLPQLLGVPAQGDTAVAKAFNVVTDLGAIEWASALTGIGALALLLIAARTTLGGFGALLALVVPTAVLVVTGNDSVQRVDDIGEIPSGLPLPALPALDQFSFDLVVGALAIAVIVMVQGAGVREVAPNADGAPSSVNGDFVAQGVGNIASGLFKGQPVGGSVGQTALNLAAGARSRWASIWSGIWMLLILVAFSGVVGQVAMPTLAAVLIFAAAGSIDVGELRTVFRSSVTSQVALATTFAATLFLPIAVAVGIGVVAVAAAPAQPRGDGPPRRAARAAGRRTFPGGARSASPGRSRRDGAGGVREPAVRRRPHAAGPVARPQRRGPSRRGPAAARPDGAGRDVRGRRRGLRGTRGRSRRAHVPQRSRSEAGGTATAHPDGRAATGQRAPGTDLRGHRARRRLDRGGGRSGAGVRENVCAVSGRVGLNASNQRGFHADWTMRDAAD